MRRTVRALVMAVTIGGILILFVLPGRTWWEQTRTMSGAERRVNALVQENATLTKNVAELQNPAYIQKLARQQYGLAPPGAQVFGINPPPAATTTTVPQKGAKP